MNKMTIIENFSRPIQQRNSYGAVEYSQTNNNANNELPAFTNNLLQHNANNRNIIPLSPALRPQQRPPPVNDYFSLTYEDITSYTYPF